MSRWRCVCWSILYAGRYGPQALGERGETVEGILDRYIESKVNWDQYTYLGLIGIDEVALKEGHRDYVANFITMPLEEITNYYFDDRQRSGFVEGFNNRVKVLKRRCYWNLRGGSDLPAVLDLEGYRLFGPTW